MLWNDASPLCHVGDALADTFLVCCLFEPYDRSSKWYDTKGVARTVGKRARFTTASFVFVLY